MKIIVFDTETTGLPITKGFNNYYSYEDLEKYNSSRLISICWKVYENNNLINSNYNIIKPEDFIIDNNSYACKINGITQEISMRDGVNINNIFDKLKIDLEDCKLIVAHNINFDKHILLSELYRYNKENIIELFLSCKLYCTMLEGTNITNIKFKNSNKLKPPKLIELYNHFFNKNFENAHNAEADVDACAACYFKMIQ